MKSKFLTFALLLFCGSLMAQQQQKNYFLYQITADQALHLAQQQDFQPDSSYFYQLVDSSQNSLFNNYPFGHFLLVHAGAEAVNISLLNRCSFQAQLLETKGELMIEVLDTNGQVIKDAVVHIGKKTIAYDVATQTYRKRKWKKKASQLLVEVGKEWLMYDLTSKKIKRYHYRRPFFSRINPIRWVRSLYRKISWSRDSDFKGYMVLNQPRFRPGDTLKLKAYLTTRKGKPLNQPLRLELRSRGKIAWRKMIEPEKKGRYYVELVLSDSLDLTLDAYQTLTFFKKHRKDWDWVYSHTFQYEDYQLDETKYSLKTDQYQYNWGEPVEIEAYGQYKTGLYLPDASVRLELLVDLPFYPQPKHFFDREVRFSKQVWTHEQILKSGGPDKIIVPDSILPKVHGTYQLNAWFKDSSGELHEKNARFSVSVPDTLGSCLQIQLEGSEIIGTYTCGDHLVHPTAWLISDSYDWETTEKVELPFRKKIDGRVAAYDLSLTGQRSAYLELNDHQPMVQVRGENRKDSLLLRINNPRELKIHYEIFMEKKKVAVGKTSGPNLNIARKGAVKTFHVYYQYHWAGGLKKEEAAFPFYEKQLQIDLIHKATVAPGEQGQVKIKVKNYKGEAVKNVDLTAGAINGQFDQVNHFTGPTIEYRRAKTPRIKREYRIQQKRWSHSQKMTAPWLDRLSLRDRLMYQLHFPEKGIHLHYQPLSQDSFYQSIAQLAPYIVKDGIAEPIYLIYVNKRLVYYYDVHDNPPYSFIGRPGKNEVRIRTRDMEYTIDQLELRNGHKLEFSIDATAVFKDQWKNKIRKKSMPVILTGQEQRLVQQSIFILKTNQFGTHILQQGDQNIHLFQYPKNTEGVIKRLFKIGPFQLNDINYHAYDKIKRRVDFEPGFSYVIHRNRERLYQYDWEILEEKLPKTLKPKQPGDLVLRPADLDAFNYPKVEINYDRSHFATRRERTGATYIFKAPAYTPQQLLFILERDSTQRILSSSSTSLQNVAPGSYNLYQLNRDGSYWRHSFSIGEQEWLFQDLSDKTFLPDTSFSLFKKVLPEQFHGKISQVETLLEKEKLRRQLSGQRIGSGASGTLTGVIRDRNGEVLIGVNVRVRGTTLGTTTDFDGYFSLEVPYSNYELEISYIGYATQLIKMDAPYGEIEVLMDESGVSLESVVVTGYSSERIKSLPTRDISALANTTAGLSMMVDTKGPDNLERVPKAQEGSNQSLPPGIQVRKNFKDYAAWQPRLSTDENGEAFYTIQYPDNTTLWKHYVIGMNDKKEAGIAISNASAYKKVMARLSVPRFFIVGDQSDLLGKSLNYRGDTLAVESTFKVDQQIVQSRKNQLGDALIEKAKVTIPQQDSLKLSYTLRSGAYGDGEEYTVPIFPKGVQETQGGFYFFNRDTTLSLEFDPANGPIQILAEQNVLDVLTQSIDYLIRYPYGCNEQMASKLTANLLAKKIKAQRGETFEKEDYIEKGIKKLSERQQAEGYWGWWRERQIDVWMTTYVLRALHEAKQLNYHVPALDKGLIYLTNNLESQHGRTLLNVLELFAELGQSLDYENQLERVLDTLQQPNLNERLTIAKIRQSQGLPVDLGAILAERKQTLFGASYWGEKQYHWYDNDIQNTLLAYQIFKAADRPEIYQPIEHYLLRQRQGRRWRNTFETARIMAVLLPTYLAQDSGLKTSDNTLVIGEQSISQKQFPYTATLLGEEKIKIKKTGRLPIYLTAYQQIWNPKPQAVTDHFVVDTWLEQSEQKTKTLQAGTLAQLKIKVEVKRKAEYLQLKVPIPAACSYENKRQRYSYRSGEIYREYFKDHVAIYCRSLKPGTYYFNIDLEPRFTGQYTLNPAKMEEMYFPVFYGRNELRVVEVE